MLVIWHSEPRFKTEDMLEVLRVIGLVLFSSVKFLFAPSTVYLSGYSFWETIAITLIGGTVGVFTFFYTGSAIFSFINERFPSNKKKKAFSKKNRLLIRVKSSWGIIGLAFISPCLISLPIGGFIAARYFRNDARTIPAFLAAVVFWSFTLTSITALVGPLFD
jgi:hypothetical protein